MHKILDQPQVQMIIAGVLGALIRFFLGAARTNQDMPAFNFLQVISAYFKKQSILLIVNALFILLLAYVADEIWNLDVVNLVVDRTKASTDAGSISRGLAAGYKIIAALTGALFDYVLDTIFGTARAWLRARAVAAGANPGDLVRVNSAMVEKIKSESPAPAMNQASLPILFGITMPFTNFAIWLIAFAILGAIGAVLIIRNNTALILKLANKLVGAGKAIVDKTGKIIKEIKS